MRILITPLNWGLGHASRCVPIIRALLQEEHEVWIASDGQALSFLKNYFPGLTFLTLPSYRIRYPFKNALLNFFRIAPRILFAAWRERQEVERLIKEHQIEVVISDNRLGCYSKKAYTVYVTHQLQFAFSSGFINQVAAALHYFWYRKFDAIWVPDLPQPHSLAGKLSVSPYGKKVQYLGLLSHLEKREAPLRYRSLILLSGPEPQRSRLEEKILKQVSQLTGTHLLVRGLPEATDPIPKEANVNIVHFLAGKALEEAMAAAEIVICRSGYSSIIDLVQLQKKALLIPTPGQPEQIYLAKKLKEANYFWVENQKTLDLQNGLTYAQQIPPAVETKGVYLQKVIEQLKK